MKNTPRYANGHAVSAAIVFFYLHFTCHFTCWFQVKTRQKEFQCDFSGTGILPLTLLTIPGRDTLLNHTGTPSWLNLHVLASATIGDLLFLVHFASALFLVN